jgi:hypothetical protein
MIGSLEITSELTGLAIGAAQQQQACATGCETIGCETTGAETTSMGADATAIGAGAGALQHADDGAGAGAGAAAQVTELVAGGQAGAGQAGAATTHVGWQLLFCLQLSFFKSQPADAGLALIKTIRHTTIVQRE